MAQFLVTFPTNYSDLTQTQFSTALQTLKDLVGVVQVESKGYFNKLYFVTTIDFDDVVTKLTQLVKAIGYSKPVVVRCGSKKQQLGLPVRNNKHL